MRKHRRICRAPRAQNIHWASGGMAARLEGGAPLGQHSVAPEPSLPRGQQQAAAQREPARLGAGFAFIRAVLAK